MIGAVIFCIAAFQVIGLHMALVLGAPIGDMTMGGRNPGVLPPGARLASFVQALLLLVFAAIVLQHVGAADLGPDLPWLIWLVVAVSALSLVANIITPSKRERLFGVPAALGLLVGSTLVALGE